MNEIEFSNNLPQIEFEINHFKKQAGLSIWEIGRRLKHVKENDLTHGQFRRWHESLGIDKDFAFKSMRISEELPNVETLRQLGITALHLITTLPEEQKEEVVQRIEDGDTPTVKELRQLKKTISEKDQLIESLGDSMHDLELQAIELDKENERLKKQPPQVIEKEVIPDDYENIKATNQQLAEQLSRVQADLNLQISKYDLLEESTASAKELERKIQSLQQTEQTITEKLNAIDAFNELEEKFIDFFDKEMAPLRFKDLANLMSATNAVDRLWAMINQVEFWADEMKKVLPNKNMKIVEGEIIDG